MSDPKRIQRKRTKGWRMPEGAIYVGRPTAYGNPYEARRCFDPSLWACYSRLSYDAVGSRFATRREARNEAVRRFRELIKHGRHQFDPGALTGHDLACWCPLDSPCHGDVLLEVANR